MIKTVHTIIRFELAFRSILYLESVLTSPLEDPPQEETPPFPPCRAATGRTPPFPSRAKTSSKSISYSHRNGSDTPVDTSQQSILLLTHLARCTFPEWASSSLTPGIAFRTLQLERAPRSWVARNQYGRYWLRREIWLGVQHLRSTLDPPNVGRLLPQGPGIYCNTWVTWNPVNDHLYRRNTPSNQPSVHPTLTKTSAEPPYQTSFKLYYYTTSTIIVLEEWAGRRKSGRVQIWFGNPAAKVFEEEAILIGTTYFTRSYVCLFCSILLPLDPPQNNSPPHQNNSPKNLAQIICFMSAADI